jgi:HEPN domain-containing protein
MSHEANQPGGKPVVVTPEPAHVRIGPLGTQLRAREFLEAGKLLQENAGRFSAVAAFLCCRSVELALKAYLLARGNTAGQVARFRHDLVRLLNEAHARGLDVVVRLSEEELSTIITANNDYTRQDLAYFDLFTTSRYANQPEKLALIGVAEKLVDGVERGCYAAADGVWNPLPSLQPRPGDEGEPS